MLRMGDNDPAAEQNTIRYSAGVQPFGGGAAVTGYFAHK
jgi:hypothetical protein